MANMLNEGMAWKYIVRAVRNSSEPSSRPHDDAGNRWFSYLETEYEQMYIKDNVLRIGRTDFVGGWDIESLPPFSRRLLSGSSASSMSVAWSSDNPRFRGRDGLGCMRSGPG